MKTLLQFAGLLVVAWCIMVTTHELGHVVGGWLGGGTLVELEIRPWHLPHSRFAPDPYPLVTLWMGPVLGVVVPLGLASVLRYRWTWLVAHFCLLANGMYLATAWFTGDRWLDTPRLLDAGAWPISIVGYCALTIGLGYRGFRRDCIDFAASRRREPPVEDRD